MKARERERGRERKREITAQFLFSNVYGRTRVINREMRNINMLIFRVIRKCRVLLVFLYKIEVSRYREPKFLNI